MTQVTQDSAIKVASKQKNVQRQALQIASPLLSLRLFAMGIVGQGGHCVLATNVRERRKVDRSFAERQMVWIRLRGHKGAKRVVEEEIPLLFYNKPIPCGSMPLPIKRLLDVEQVQAHA